MNLTFLDLAIVVFIFFIVVAAAIHSRKYNRSIADFLSANRTAGRYLISVSGGMAAIGVFNVIGAFEMYYNAGFCIEWWGLMTLPISTIIVLSGWIIYRFRETRALTLAQFFEMRYSKNFRVFTGIIAFVSGLINFGIFPAVGARFFVHYCNIPQYLNIAGFSFETYILIMAALLAISVVFIFLGGQITVMVTDFFQGMFCNIAFVIIIIFFMFKFDWSSVVRTLMDRPVDQSFFNPFQTSQVKDFNIWFILIGIFHSLYNHMSWQQAQAYNTSAKSAHEAKMGMTLGRWRVLTLYLLWLLIPLTAYVIMHNSEYSSIAQQAKTALASISNEQVRSQMTVPTVIGFTLPAGLLGIFLTVMLLAFIANHDTIIHSWASIFIQDVVMPLRKNPLTPKQHMFILKLAVFGVAIFVFFYSLLFRQTQYLLMYAALSASIFLGGAGAVIIGGLYWKKGTTSGAWAAMIVGAVIGTAGIVCDQIWPSISGGKKFPMNGQWIYMINMASSLSAYILVSIITYKKEFDLDKMLHRDKPASTDVKKESVPVYGLRAIGIGSEFSKFDKVVYYSLLAWSFGWFLLFATVTLLKFTVGLPDGFWPNFWRAKIWIYFTLGTIITVWFAIGGFRDLINMYKTLSTMKRDSGDDGHVEHNE
ncbi:MAG: hypothetical protein A2Y12_18015 [Planctomycetes bacterium GWF2_42_9]|nr:MAG: hypothetical protein A2Y12_18015 [Planctomycetes bacterium GWF2_42_9]